MRVFVPLLFLLLCASGPPRCVETEAYLADPAAAEPDPRLIGEWLGVLPNGYVRIFPEKEENPGVLRIVYVEIPNRVEGEPVAYASFRAWRTTLGGKAYLNVERIAAHPASHWKDLRARMIVRYEHVGDDGMRLRWAGGEVEAKGGLKFLYLEPAKIEAAIKAGRVAGRIEGEGDQRRVTITAPREALRALFAAKESDDLFRHKSGEKEEENAIILLRLPTRK